MSRAQPLRLRVLEVIRQSPGGIGIKALSAALPDMTVQTIHRLLQELRETGDVAAAGYARYRVPTPWPPSSAGKLVRGQPLHRLMAGR
jgi:hypothetical protein